MTRIAIIGGTGYSGSNIAREAIGRGYTVTAVARHAPSSPIVGVDYLEGALDDAAFLERLAADHDVLVVAVHAVGEDGRPVLLPVMPALARAAVSGGARLGVIGGAGSALVSADGPRVVDTPDFPEQFKPEALGHGEVLEWLRRQDGGLDWFYLSPAAGYGGYASGEATGHYRIGGDVLVVSDSGASEISGADFALAFVDEIATPAHRRARFTVGY